MQLICGSIIATVSFLLPGIAQAQQTAPTQPPCRSAEHRQFDFWQGEWNVYLDGGSLAGTNRVESILGGCVLMENWNGTSGSTGKSFNHYSAVDGTWRQTWVDNAGLRLDLEGGLDDRGRMVLRGTTTGRDGKPVQHELTFTPNSDGSVLQHWRSSRDGGASWNDAFRGTYRKQ